MDHSWLDGGGSLIHLGLLGLFRRLSLLSASSVSQSTRRCLSLRMSFGHRRPTASSSFLPLNSFSKAHMNFTTSHIMHVSFFFSHKSQTLFTFTFAFFIQFNSSHALCLPHVPQISSIFSTWDFFSIYN